MPCWVRACPEGMGELRGWPQEWLSERCLSMALIASLHTVTPVDCGGGGSGTWSRSGPPKKEELVGGKKKGRTWGPSSTLQKERAGGEERYGGPAALLPCARLTLALTPLPVPP